VKHADVVLHLVDHRRIHRRRRLVQQQQLRIRHERRREREQLALAAGQLAGGRGGAITETDELEQPPGPPGSPTDAAAYR